ncbi:COQ9 family protein [Silicimonas algicola]|uniref:Ubiquinone biosynthesis protein COQ9 n=1 Tax=Silicimonas algicola TaxID=1826607 RepID=A0A316FZP1_9RHOB|nr:COQ9 family protein [Silicimonas algicola]AZQ69005.1 COQ9 family protein [Silicimonas algicola]PWK54111.1 ubiquinone biosynthesis protein COQ9 [Silicimonas algicola]
MTKTLPTDPRLEALLDAALDHVPFDGWSPATFRAATSEAGMTEAEAKALAPRGAIDLAVALHRRGDRAMVEKMASVGSVDMRYRDRVSAALHYRVEALPDREVARKSSALFSLPTHAAEGAKLIWETSDAIWTALGDTSRDGNWYSKRATLSAVWGSVVLYWLGDDSIGHERTKEFIDRRIDNVMSVEEIKGRLRKNPLTKPLMEIQAAIMGRVKAPSRADRSNLPGRWSPDT